MSVVQLPVNKDLAFSDISCQIGNRMGDIYPNPTTKFRENSGLYMCVATVEITSSPSLGIVKMGIWVMEPFRPWTRPARS